MTVPSHSEQVERAAEIRRALLLRAEQDPDFAKKRSKVAARIRQELEQSLALHGFHAEWRAGPWQRRGWWYDLGVELQRGKYGHDAWINLTAIPRLLPGKPVTRRLGSFYHGSWHPDEPGRLTYQALIEDPDLLDEPMRILRERALPWLLGKAGFLPR